MSEVPQTLATVRGIAVTEWPRDLYIPPDALEVLLEQFEGPLDLLLYLIRRNNLDIRDIPIAEITRQYTAYLELMVEMQLELAAEYLVMAASLAEIKSRLLLPRPTQEHDDNDEDPRAELVRRLQDYEYCRRAAEALDALPRLGREVQLASALAPPLPPLRVLPTVELEQLRDALRVLIERQQLTQHHAIRRETLSVRERMSQLLDRLQDDHFIAFEHLLDPSEGRMGVVVTLLATLELVRESLLDLVQHEPFAPLHLRRRRA